MREIVLTKAKLNLIGWVSLICQWGIYLIDGSSLGLIFMAFVTLAIFVTSLILEE